MLCTLLLYVAEKQDIAIILHLQMGTSTQLNVDTGKRLVICHPMHLMSSQSLGALHIASANAAKSVPWMTTSSCSLSCPGPSSTWLRSEISMGFSLMLTDCQG